MKITKRQLRRIIKEEKAKLSEQFQGSMIDLEDHNTMVQQLEEIIAQWEMKGYTREDVGYAILGIVEELK